MKWFLGDYLGRVFEQLKKNCSWNIWSQNSQPIDFSKLGTILDKFLEQLLWQRLKKLLGQLLGQSLEQSLGQSLGHLIRRF